MYPLGMIREPVETAERGGRLKGREAIAPRYGSLRSFMLRTLYSWLTMSMPVSSFRASPVICPMPPSLRWP